MTRRSVSGPRLPVRGQRPDERASVGGERTHLRAAEAPEAREDEGGESREDDPRTAEQPAATERDAGEHEEEAGGRHRSRHRRRRHVA